MLLCAVLSLTAVEEKQMRKAIGFRYVSPSRILLEAYCYGYEALTPHNLLCGLLGLLGGCEHFCLQYFRAAISR